MLGAYQHILTGKTTVPANGSVIDKRVDDKRVVVIVKISKIVKLASRKLPKRLLKLIEIIAGFGKVAPKFLLNGFVEVL